MTKPVRFLGFCFAGWDDGRPSGWESCVMQSTALSIDLAREELAAAIVQTAPPTNDGRVFNLFEVGEDYQIVSTDTWAIVEQGKVELTWADDHDHYCSAALRPSEGHA